MGQNREAPLWQEKFGQQIDHVRQVVREETPTRPSTPTRWRSNMAGTGHIIHGVRGQGNTPSSIPSAMLREARSDLS
jgi:hypothetical protein